MSKKYSEIKINIPEGYEIDQKNSDLSKGIITFKENNKNLKYSDVLDALRKKSKLIKHSGTEIPNYYYANVDLFGSIYALIRLCNVAAYLNEGWTPAKNTTGLKYHIGISYQDRLSSKSSLIIYKHETVQYSCVYFRNKRLAEKAIEILGEATIYQALTLNYK